MTNKNPSLNITPSLAQQLILEQFPQYSHLPLTEPTEQGHDNRTYLLGEDMLIRLPTAEPYALAVTKEQNLLPKLAPHLSTRIPHPIKMGTPSKTYPFPFSIYRWLPGTSLNLCSLSTEEINQLALDLAKFLKELQSVTDLEGPKPGQHNWWRGDHPSVYGQDALQQIEKLKGIIDTARATHLWQKACATQWNKPPVWIHGDFAISNLIMQNGQLSAVIDFGCAALGDPACDLVIAWTYLSGKARQLFISEMNLDENTWLRAKAWALWKATYELCHLTQKKSHNASIQQKIINDLLLETTF